MQSRHWIGRWRLSALGVVLCLLAAVFAIEAKLALYSPDGSVRVEFSATQLQPADPPRLAAQALASPVALHHITAEGPLLLAFTTMFLVVFLPRKDGGMAAPYNCLFSPPVYSRPPPHS